ncbi:thioredoxin [Sphingobacteriales bacterium UPWRP_1]|nr:thioredoxin [Sphingobacteriales bacterium TSM_CSS]PSJ79033.1 thioredoxin [Sphingobacteriales bacterium UPWRP_1]
MSHFNFEEEVIAASYQQPVVIDFWAPWCGPCRFIGPVLEELAALANGQWKLVKINSDEHPELANQYDVRGIPAIKMIHKGTVKAEFVGALPKYQVEKWLDANLPDAREETLHTLLAQLQHPETAQQALTQLETMAVQHPGYTPAQIAYARQIVWLQPQQATEMVKNIGEFDKWSDAATDIRNFAQLAVFALPDEQPANPAAQGLLDAKQAQETQNPDAAIAAIIRSVAADKNYLNSFARKLAISFFRTWGPDHPLTRKYRPVFDRTLY